MSQVLSDVANDDHGNCYEPNPWCSESFSNPRTNPYQPNILSQPFAPVQVQPAMVGLKAKHCSKRL
eukprot:6018648-Amphidinium_carterae.1